MALGWSREQVIVIDDDQGLSGQSADGRLGFQRMLAEVSLDQVGLILGLEMSRLARSCKDWHQLLELCAIFRTLLADQDGLYDPTEFNVAIAGGRWIVWADASEIDRLCRLRQQPQTRSKLHPGYPAKLTTPKTNPVPTSK